MSTSDGNSYHHGDLRAALLTTAMEMLEEGEPFSLRAIARSAGVSPTAPYRHFADRDALESDLVAQGFQDLKADLLADRALPSSIDDLADFGVSYVDFALRRPALFRLMFGNECDEANEERVRATTELHELLEIAAARVFPDGDAPALASAGWALAHGLAALHLSQKLDAADVANQVRTTFHAIFAAGEPADAAALDGPGPAISS